VIKLLRVLRASCSGNWRRQGHATTTPATQSTNCDTPHMARKPRQLESISFRPDGLGSVTDRMAQLATAGDGWINLIPRMSDDDDDNPTSLGFLTLFGGGGPGMTMCTWIPGTRDHAAQTQSSLGIAHQTGHRAVTELASRNTAVPQTWVVEQDHRPAHPKRRVKRTRSDLGSARGQSTRNAPPRQRMASGHLSSDLHVVAPVRCRPTRHSYGVEEIDRLRRSRPCSV